MYDKVVVLQFQMAKSMERAIGLLMPLAQQVLYEYRRTNDEGFMDLYNNIMFDSQAMANELDRRTVLFYDKNCTTDRSS